MLDFTEKIDFTFTKNHAFSMKLSFTFALLTGAIVFLLI